ncbi:hypothetical protein RRG08_055596 [Elysia crispata]|uniref:Uncharacterized protein n=1 Tax=Elysia crispata TaxID=231223 RepID=A0AAE1E925_9GAST|nr:hypothetical protein RRG08_055596 [Elysia crispata]
MLTSVQRGLMDKTRLTGQPRFCSTSEPQPTWYHTVYHGVLYLHAVSIASDYFTARRENKEKEERIRSETQADQTLPLFYEQCSMAQEMWPGGANLC